MGLLSLAVEKCGSTRTKLLCRTQEFRLAGKPGHFAKESKVSQRDEAEIHNSLRADGAQLLPGTSIPSETMKHFPLNS